MTCRNGMWSCRFGRTPTPRLTFRTRPYESEPNSLSTTTETEPKEASPRLMSWPPRCSPPPVGWMPPTTIPTDLALLLSASVKAYPGEMMVTNGPGTDKAGPWISSGPCGTPRRPSQSQSATSRTRSSRCPNGFPSTTSVITWRRLLIASGADIKTVQARMRHATARTTLDTYSHLWPDADESTRSAVGAVIAKRMDSFETAANDLRTT